MPAVHEIHIFATFTFVLWYMWGGVLSSSKRYHQGKDYLFTWSNFHSLTCSLQYVQVLFLFFSEIGGEILSYSQVSIYNIRLELVSGQQRFTLYNNFYTAFAIFLNFHPSLSHLLYITIYRVGSFSLVHWELSYWKWGARLNAIEIYDIYHVLGQEIYKTNWFHILQILAVIMNNTMDEYTESDCLINYSSTSVLFWKYIRDMQNAMSS